MTEVWTTITAPDCTAQVNADQSIAKITGRAKKPWYDKINPLWWLVGDNGWDVPTINNGAPYLPNVKNIWLRRFYWFFCRNPLMNFVGYVIGVGDWDYTVYGSRNVLCNTGRDTVPPTHGWRWAVINAGWLWLPFINYFNGSTEFYFGWRPTSGGLGFKLVFHKNG